MSSAGASAEPDALDEYVQTVGPLRSALTLDANALMLSFVPAAPYVGARHGVTDLSTELRVYLNDCSRRDAWVSDVAEAFRSADRKGRLPAVRRPAPFRRPAGPDPSGLAPELRIDLDPFAHARPVHHTEWQRLVVPHGADPGTMPRYLGEHHVLEHQGRRYPLVVPWIIRGGTVYNADHRDPGATERSPVLTLEGTDTGWTTVAWTTGIHRVPAAAGFWSRLAVGFAASAGHSQMYMPPAYYQRGGLSVSASGVATAREPEELESRKPPDSPDDLLPNPRDAGPRGRTAAAGAELLEMTTQVWAAATADQHREFSYYHVVLQRNADGRTRAFARNYQVLRHGTGRLLVSSDYWTGRHAVAMVHLTPDAEGRDDGQRRDR